MREQIKHIIQTVEEKIGIKLVPQTAVAIEEARKRIERDQEDASEVTKASRSPAKK